MYLQRPDIAQIVIDSISKGVELGHYELDAYVVMANHVHLLIRPAIAPDLLLKSLKGTTARYANRLLGRTGEPFWQKESYDHWVRNKSEFDLRRYANGHQRRVRLVPVERQNPIRPGRRDKNSPSPRGNRCGASQ